MRSVVLPACLAQELDVFYENAIDGLHVVQRYVEVIALRCYPVPMRWHRVRTQHPSVLFRRCLDALLSTLLGQQYDPVSPGVYFPSAVLPKQDPRRADGRCQQRACGRAVVAGATVPTRPARAHHTSFQSHATHRLLDETGGNPCCLMLMLCMWPTYHIAWT